jgi:ribose-phosphate pyrophosphokinase
MVQAFADGEVQGRALASALACPFGLVTSRAFPDGESLVSVPWTADTVIVHRSLDRPNCKLVELILAAEAWRRLGVRRLVLVAPYLSYMRQDRAFAPGQAVSQRAMAALLSTYFDRVVTVNAHLHRTHSLAELFSIPAQDLSAGPAIGARLSDRDAPDVVVGPDEESGPLAHAAAAALGARCVILSKTRKGDSDVEMAPDPQDDVRGRSVVLVDDICSTGATLAAAAERMRAMGAAKVDVFVVHALFEAGAEARLKAAGVGVVASSDAVAHPSNALSLAPLLAQALASELS